MLRKITRELGFRFLSIYATLEEARVEKLEKEGYILKDAADHKNRLDTLHMVLKKLYNEKY